MISAMVARELMPDTFRQQVEDLLLKTYRCIARDASQNHNHTHVGFQLSQDVVDEVRARLEGLGYTVTPNKKGPGFRVQWS